MICSSHFTLAILLMACIVFTCRYLFFTTSFQIKLHPCVKKLLVFTAPCVLTAIIVPLMFQHGVDKVEGTNLFNSSYFWAGLSAVVLSFFIRQTLLVIILSMSGFYAMRYLGLT